MHVVPAFVFVSAYMSLVTLLSDTYYSYSNYNNHFAKPALLMVVVCCYIILAVVGLITFGKKNYLFKINFKYLVSKSFKTFAYLSEFLIGLIYLVLGTMIIYYGEKIALVVAVRQYSNTFEPTTNDMSVKLRILSVTIGGLFLLKSLFGLLTAMKFFDDFYPVSIGANVWDFFVI
jgi:hypothetical protein